MGEVRTIRDVARIAGVSVASVSRTINDSGYVSPSTREKIEKVIREYDFHPNMSARDLKTRSSSLIAFVISDEINEYYYNLIEVINRRIKSDGYSMIVCNSFNDPLIEKRNLAMLSNGAVSCIILNRCLGNEAFITRLSRRIPIILLHRRIRDEEFKGDYVDADFPQAAYVYTKMLLGKGHRRIAFVSGNLELGSFADRFAAFRKAMQEEGVDGGEYEDCIRTGTATIQMGGEAMESLMSQPMPPSAALICHNLICIGALRWLKRNRIEIPDRLSIAAPCNLNLNDLYYVSISSALPDLEELGGRIAQYAISRIRDEAGQIPCRSSVLHVNLLFGDSIREAGQFT